jgi:hypothetical protein
MRYFFPRKKSAAGPARSSMISREKERKASAQETTLSFPLQPKPRVELQLRARFIPVLLFQGSDLATIWKFGTSKAGTQALQPISAPLVCARPKCYDRFRIRLFFSSGFALFRDRLAFFEVVPWAIPGRLLNTLVPFEKI